MYFISMGHMNSVDYKRLRHSSKLLSVKEHNVQKTFLGHLFSDFPLSFQLDNQVSKGYEDDSLNVKELPQGKEVTAAPLEKVEKVEKSSAVDIRFHKEEGSPNHLDNDLKKKAMGKATLDDFSHCDNCMVGHLRVKERSSSDVFEEQGVEILFLGGYPKETSKSLTCSFDQLERELLEKMAGAMGLQRGFAISRSLKFVSGKKSVDLFEVIEGDKVENYEEWLTSFLKEIEIFKPQFIIPLGAIPTNLLLRNKERLSQVHGKFFPKGFKLPSGLTHNVLICPIFHPEFLLINPNMKRTAWMDLQKVMGHLQKNLVKNSVEL